MAAAPRPRRGAPTAAWRHPVLSRRRPADGHLATTRTAMRLTSGSRWNLRSYDGRGQVRAAWSRAASGQDRANGDANRYGGRDPDRRPPTVARIDWWGRDAAITGARGWRRRCTRIVDRPTTLGWRLGRSRAVAASSSPLGRGVTAAVNR